MESLGFVTGGTIDLVTIQASLIDFVLNPYSVAVFSVLIALAINEVWNLVRRSRRRIAAFRMLERELENQKRILVAMNEQLHTDESSLYPSIDPFTIQHFLTSEFIQVDADTKLIGLLQGHIQNLSELNHGILRVDSLATVWESVASSTLRGELEQTMKEIMDLIIETVDDCLDIVANKKRRLLYRLLFRS